MLQNIYLNNVDFRSCNIHLKSELKSCVRSKQMLVKNYPITVVWYALRLGKNHQSLSPSSLYVREMIADANFFEWLGLGDANFCGCRCLIAVASIEFWFWCRSTAEVMISQGSDPKGIFRFYWCRYDKKIQNRNKKL